MWAVYLIHYPFFCHPLRPDTHVLLDQFRAKSKSAATRPNYSFKLGLIVNIFWYWNFCYASRFELNTNGPKTEMPQKRWLFINCIFTTLKGVKNIPIGAKIRYTCYMRSVECALLFVCVCAMHYISMAFEPESNNHANLLPNALHTI